MTKTSLLSLLALALAPCEGWKFDPAIYRSGQCPMTIPWVYQNGDKCCPYDLDADFNSITAKSTSCLFGKGYNCPGGKGKCSRSNPVVCHLEHGGSKRIYQGTTLVGILEKSKCPDEPPLKCLEFVTAYTQSPETQAVLGSFNDQRAACPTGSFIKDFNIERGKGSPREIRYRYTCCKSHHGLCQDETVANEWTKYRDRGKDEIDGYEMKYLARDQRLNCPDNGLLRAFRIETDTSARTWRFVSTCCRPPRHQLIVCGYGFSYWVRASLLQGEMYCPGDSFMSRWRIHYSPPAKKFGFPNEGHIRHEWRCCDVLPLYPK